MENARELLFKPEMDVIAQLQGDSSIAPDRVCHACCRRGSLCAVGSPNSVVPSDPLIAVYNIKTPELFHAIDDHAMVAEGTVNTLLQNSIAHINFDYRCLRDIIVDASVCAELRRLAALAAPPSP